MTEVTITISESRNGRIKARLTPPEKSKEESKAFRYGLVGLKAIRQAMEQKEEVGDGS